MFETLFSGWLVSADLGDNAKNRLPVQLVLDRVIVRKFEQKIF